MFESCSKVSARVGLRRETPSSVPVPLQTTECPSWVVPSPAPGPPRELADQTLSASAAASFPLGPPWALRAGSEGGGEGEGDAVPEELGATELKRPSVQGWAGVAERSKTACACSALPGKGHGHLWDCLSSAGEGRSWLHPRLVCQYRGRACEFVRAQPHRDHGGIPRSRRAACPISLSCTLASRGRCGWLCFVQLLAVAWWPFTGPVPWLGHGRRPGCLGSGRPSPAHRWPRLRAAPRPQQGRVPGEHRERAVSLLMLQIQPPIPKSKGLLCKALPQTTRSPSDGSG